MKKLKIALLWVNPYSENRGVGALSYSVLYLLEQITEKFNVQMEYYVIGTSNNRRDNDKITIADKEVAITNVLNISGTKIKTFAKKIIYRNQYKLYKTFDCVLDIGEGDSYTDIYGQERFNRLNNTKQCFLKKGIKQMLLPQTIGPFNDRKTGNKAIKTINKCDIVLAPDKQSYNFLKEYTAQKNIDEIIDVAFHRPAHDETRIQQH